MNSKLKNQYKNLLENKIKNDLSARQNLNEVSLWAYLPYLLSAGRAGLGYVLTAPWLHGTGSPTEILNPDNFGIIDFILGEDEPGLPFGPGYGFPPDPNMTYPDDPQNRPYLDPFGRPRGHPDYYKPNPWGGFWPAKVGPTDRPPPEDWYWINYPNEPPQWWNDEYGPAGDIGSSQHWKWVTPPGYWKNTQTGQLWDPFNGQGDPTNPGRPGKWITPPTNPLFPGWQLSPPYPGHPGHGGHNVINPYGSPYPYHPWYQPNLPPSGPGWEGTPSPLPPVQAPPQNPGHFPLENL